MSPFNKILVVGAGGSIGSVMLEALLKEPAFTVTVLQRASSHAVISPSVRTITVPDSYPAEALVDAFRGQDAVVNCITSLNVREQFRFVDAAVAAGVRRYVPSEYGLDNLKPKARALNAVFDGKGAVQAYLRSREGEIEWTSFSCGMWLRWSAAHDFLGMRLREKKFVLWDEGNGYFSCTTEENTALALVSALTRSPEETRNKNIFLSDFAVTQRQLLAEIERQLGEKMVVEKVDSYKLVKEKQAAVRAGDRNATYALIETGFVTGRYGGHLEKEGEIWNERLGLPRRSVEEVVQAALKGINLL
ncbi:isoflavone reductase like protein irl [Pleurostoma richardsiae]|uniref:Isoflavone reductase like protein irl n=1 Tax=Pleurostoma richardsiae TaxID=41990 RepID=A0AA38R7E7_9PEZI|nr:isoflavone reductase like protein irl [Pleurostoma richardsiae]